MVFGCRWVFDHKSRQVCSKTHLIAADFHRGRIVGPVFVFPPLNSAFKRVGPPTESTLATLVATQVAGNQSMILGDSQPAGQRTSRRSTEKCEDDNDPLAALSRCFREATD